MFEAMLNGLWRPICRWVTFLISLLHGTILCDILCIVICFTKFQRIPHWSEVKLLRSRLMLIRCSFYWTPYKSFLTESEKGGIQFSLAFISNSPRGSNEASVTCCDTGIFVWDAWRTGQWRCSFHSQFKYSILALAAERQQVCAEE